MAAKLKKFARNCTILLGQDTTEDDKATSVGFFLKEFKKEPNPPETFDQLVIDVLVEIGCDDQRALSVRVDAISALCHLLRGNIFFRHTVLDKNVVGLIVRCLNTATDLGLRDACEGVMLIAFDCCDQCRGRLRGVSIEKNYAAIAYCLRHSAPDSDLFEVALLQLRRLVSNRNWDADLEKMECAETLERTGDPRLIKFALNLICLALREDSDMVRSGACDPILERLLCTTTVLDSIARNLDSEDRHAMKIVSAVIKRPSHIIALLLQGPEPVTTMMQACRTENNRASHVVRYAYTPSGPAFTALSKFLEAVTPRPHLLSRFLGYGVLGPLIDSANVHIDHFEAQRLDTVLRRVLTVHPEFSHVVQTAGPWLQVRAPAARVARVIPATDYVVIDEDAMDF